MQRASDLIYLLLFCLFSEQLYVLLLLFAIFIVRSYKLKIKFKQPSICNGQNKNKQISDGRFAAVELIRRLTSIQK